MDNLFSLLRNASDGSGDEVGSFEDFEESVNRKFLKKVGAHFSPYEILILSIGVTNSDE